jgi:hypothetical protein
MMSNRFAVIAIPLGRPAVVAALQPPRAVPRGAPLAVIGQRPTPIAVHAWCRRLAAANPPTVADLLAIDDPGNHLVSRPTDRLVPIELLADPEYLTRNLGGWAAIYFNVAALPSIGGDPVLAAIEVLAEYGADIRCFGADPSLVAARLNEETDCDVVMLADAFVRLERMREAAPDLATFIERLYVEISSGERFNSLLSEPLPDVMLYDTLMAAMVDLELERRAALARFDRSVAAAIAERQQAWQARSGLRLLLKGEYIMGRHRRSTVLLAPELGVVVKQPAPEPFHEIALAARTYDGRTENWPRLTEDGALVTPRGRLRLLVEEGLVPKLGKLLGHQARLSTLLGLIVEPFVAGKTSQELVIAEPFRLDADLYAEYVLHQQVCELLGIENGDWHAANFICRADADVLVHIDWGAARPLRADELTDAGRRARLDQVANIGFSFNDPALARRGEQLHAELLAAPERLAAIRARARAIVG